MPTNASLLTDDRINKILSSGLDEIRFSIDGFGDTYKKLRHVEYSKTCEVMNFLEAHKKTHSEIKIVFVSVVNDITLPTITEWQRHWGKYGRTEIQRVGHFNDVRKEPCTAIGLFQYVWHNLDVSPCCMDYNGEIVLGNLRKNSIHEIHEWKNPEAVAVIQPK